VDVTSEEYEYCAWCFDTHDWLGLRSFADRMIRASSRGSYQKWGASVDRLEAYFTQHFHKPAWSTDGECWSPERIQEARFLLVQFIAAFGSLKPLCDDILAAVNSGARPYNLLYFIARKDHQTSRWDMLISDKRERDWQRVKEEEANVARQLDKEDSPLATLLKSMSASFNTPADKFWITAARSSYKAALLLDNIREAERIKAKLATFGVEV